ncbi:MAG: carboxymuconolactone decarboxylase family protein [Bradyrhizobium sp.]
MTEIARLTLEKKSRDNAEPGAKAALEAVQKGLGFIPNMYANMANSPGALETYGVGYKFFRGDGGFTPAEQEVVFLTISHENGCEYCMAAHSMVGEKMSGVPAPVLSALRSGLPLPDAKLQALSVFTRIMVASRGKPTRQDLQVFLAAGFSERQVMEIILAIAVKTISNYSNHVFHTEVDPVFAAYRWETPKAA